MTNKTDLKLNEIAKGLQVRARGYVQSGYFWRSGVKGDPARSIVCDPGEREHYIARMLIRWDVPFEGIVVGISHRVTGLNWLKTNRWNDIDASLKDEKRHVVVMIQSTHTSRYQKPRACLLKDLEVMS